MEKLFIISNESVFNYEGNFFCDNIDLKSTPEGLNKKFQVNLIARKSKKKRFHQIRLKNIKIHANIISFLREIAKTFKENTRYLIISITPFTFLATILIRIFSQKPIVYLRSDGYREYSSIFGFLGPIIFHLMFYPTCKISNLISCQKYILHGRKGDIIYPSQLDDDWFNEVKDPNLEKLKLLYVGRVKKEKGIFSLIKILKKKNKLSYLTIVGAEKNINKKNFKDIDIQEIQSDKKKLIKIYDDHNILVLPSFTEGYPMVILEALARLTPVIIFEEIKHVAENKEGIFIAKRNESSFFEKIDYIMNNYDTIRIKMKKNNLVRNHQFISNLEKAISKF
tara:strand:+ start:23 stop:1036 length:1014 start_codon:yes stop_codon:yes gene_type:complete